VSSQGAVRNPIFARVFVRLSRNESEEQRRYRQELLAGLSGRVVDLGAGEGANFHRFPASVTEVIAVEPEPYLRARAEEKAASASAPVTVVDGLADDLPVEDGWADAVISALVLCTVPHQAAALAEVRRVLRPGGELRFYEHVVADTPGFARFQRVLDRSGVWRTIGGGCHTARDTASAIEAAGFTMERCRRMSVKPSPLVLPVAPHVLGVARR
jgi:ubiquinone/menaquinone biosynthesis C-methylase UbiE